MTTSSEGDGFHRTNLTDPADFVLGRAKPQSRVAMSEQTPQNGTKLELYPDRELQLFRSPLKYAILIMRADNHREGGIVELLARDPVDRWVDLGGFTAMVSSPRQSRY